LAQRLEGKQGYALTEQLDEIVGSPEFAEVFAEVCRAVDEQGFDAELAEDLELGMFLDQLESPKLRHLVGRTYAALAAALEIMPEQLVHEFTSELRDPHRVSEELAEMDSPELPAPLRRYLRHVVRGQAALVCLPFASRTEALQRELLTHAAVGAETNLRLLAAAADAPGRASVILVDLRLDPIDLDALHERGKELQAARASLREAQAALPEFRLPPDPELQD
jgi:hypothetical protein